MDLARYEPQLLAGAILGTLGYVGWSLWARRQAEAAAAAAAGAEVTPQAQLLVAGETPLALDLGAGNVADQLPGTSAVSASGIPLNPYTGQPLYSEIDPTTGEVGIGHVEQIDGRAYAVL